MYSYVGQVFVTQKQVRVGNIFQGLLHVTLYNQYQTEGYEFQNLYCPSRTISKPDCSIFFFSVNNFTTNAWWMTKIGYVCRLS